MTKRFQTTYLSRETCCFHVERLELRRLLTGVGPSDATLYEPGVDPKIGAVVTAFLENDPSDADDSWDIRTNWLEAVDELASIGATEVTFAVYRVVGANGRMRGGPSVSTVHSAVARANQQGLAVTLLPLFELDQLDWRGDYDPSGAARTRFQQDYSALVTDLANISGVSRLNIGSELNAMVNNASNQGFFQGLINAVQATGFAGKIGYVANFDAYNNAQHAALWQNAEIDYLGISAYFSIIAPQDATLVAGTGPMSSTLASQMLANWNSQLDQLEQFAANLGLPILIQEFGAVPFNYSSVYPWAVRPGDFLNGGANPEAADANEQSALYESFVTALDGRADTIEAAHFWSWEHGADRGERSYKGVDPNETRYINRFAVWQNDGGGGEFLADYLATAPDNTSAKAVDDSYVVGEGAPLEINAAVGVLANDQDIDGNALTVTLVTGPNEGSLDLHKDGSFSYSHHGSEVSSDSFRYQVSDGRGGHSTALVTLAIQPVNDAPIASIVGAAEIQPGYQSSFWAVASDVDSSQLTYQFEILDDTGSTVATSTTMQLPFAPDVSGVFTARLEVSDGVAATVAEMPFTVSPILQVANTLRIFGTNHNDKIVIKPARSALGDGLNFVMNGEKFAFESGVTELFVYGAGGDDLIKVSRSAKLQAWITANGGLGNDRLVGGRYDDTLRGDSGADRISGGKGNDWIDGGEGVDQINGGAGDDTLIGGTAGGGDDLASDRLAGKSGLDRFMIGIDDQILDFNNKFDEVLDT